MRLKSLTIKNAPPVQLFSVADLSDVVVIAGPNGVGKTRLLQRLVVHLRNPAPVPDITGTVEATGTPERTAWAKESLDLSSPQDMQLFRNTLQANRRRQNLQSSLVNFESDRSIQNLVPFPFQWDMADPLEEQISWDLTFGGMRDRFQDTVHSMYRMIEAQKQGIATRAIELRRQGEQSMKLAFEDPMRPFKDVFSLLLAPKELVDPSARQQRLEYRLDGNVYDFGSLSSGEREVVNIAFDFLLRKPQDCIVFFDEPELHLHPELSYRLLQTLQQIGDRNQFIFLTHSPDVITAALDRTVIFISPPQPHETSDPVKNQAIVVSENDETNTALRLLGQSIGIIALGRRLVLVEGEQSSLDKQTYGSIIRALTPGLVLVPSGGKHVLESFAAIYKSVLKRSIWGVEFFMLCDGDSRPLQSVSEAEARSSGHLRVLSRYHLENYFLDETIWAEALEQVEPAGSWAMDPAKVREAFRQEARNLISYATALAVARDVRQLVGNIDIMPKDCHRKSLAELQALLDARVTAESARIEGGLEVAGVMTMAANHYQGAEASIERDSDQWKLDLPGKQLLGWFAAKLGLKSGHAKHLYLRTAEKRNPSPFQEIYDIFRDFAASS